MPTTATGGSPLSPSPQLQLVDAYRQVVTSDSSSIVDVVLPYALQQPSNKVMTGCSCMIGGFHMLTVAGHNRLHCKAHNWHESSKASLSLRTLLWCVSRVLMSPAVLSSWCVLGVLGVLLGWPPRKQRDPHVYSNSHTCICGKRHVWAAQCDGSTYM